jgi:DNA primase
MISTKTIVCGLIDVPWNWSFQYYLKLAEQLTGQDVRMSSVFNLTEKTPSFYVYFDSNANRYKFKDFSTGKQGDAVTLVKELFNLSTRGEAAFKIVEDYNQYLINNPNGHIPNEFKEHKKYKVTDFLSRQWTTDDQKYWMKYGIGSKLLNTYNVKPLQEYIMSKTEDADLKELHIKGPRIYGYFKQDGSLYKIYNPMVKDCKFINVMDYVQGTEQLSMAVPYLIITSSMKDLLTFVKLGYKNAEAIAPNSENSLLPEYMISAYKLKYTKIVVLFDNDSAGIKAMEKYKERYAFNYVHLNLEKDLSDSVEKWGINKVREIVTPLLKISLK